MGQLIGFAGAGWIGGMLGNKAIFATLGFAMLVGTVIFQIQSRRWPKEEARGKKPEEVR